jgi:DNA-binding CsgD family transcriptional regulator/PAS domain-containing protein
MKRFIEKDLPRLLDLIYDAGLDPERWPKLLDALPELFGAAIGGLDVLDRKTNATRQFLNFGSDPAFVATYAQHYGAVNPYPRAALLEAPVGRVIPATSLLAEEDLAGTEFFNDWMRPQGISPHHLRVVLQKDKDSLVLLAISSGERETERRLDALTKKLELLAPHLVRAIDLNHVLAEARFANRAAADALQSLVTAAFVLDRGRRIVLANARAEELMRSERVLSLDEHGALHAARPEDDWGLAAALAAGVCARHPAPVRLVSRTSAQTFFASVIPSRPHSGEASLRFRIFEALGVADSVLLLVVPFGGIARVRRDTIAATFGLSTAEARLASALVDGATLAEYARQTGVSVHTVRNQLGAIFSKTGTHRQSAVVALLSRALGGRLAETTDAACVGGPRAGADFFCSI